MDYYDTKYGINSKDKIIVELHRNRRMFAIKEDKLYLAPLHAEYTHAKWFEKLGWITKENDKAMDELVRGFIDSTGIYFYKGYDFSYDKEAEKIILKNLNKIINLLHLSKETCLFGGLVKQKIPGKWKPIKEYGKVEQFL